MNGKHLAVTLATDLSRDRLTAEITVDSDLMGMVVPVDGELRLWVFPPAAQKWDLSLHDCLEALQEVANKLRSEADDAQGPQQT
jgi:hypothetical protein